MAYTTPKTNTKVAHATATGSSRCAMNLHITLNTIIPQITLSTPKATRPYICPSSRRF